MRMGLREGRTRAASCFTAISLAAIGWAAIWSPAARGQQATEFKMEYTNPGLSPSHWVLKLSPDGSGHFDADGAQRTPQELASVQTGEVHREIQLSGPFTVRVFSIARQRKLFAFACESHMKVAFQGTKRLSYSGPDGSGSCEYNYSKDKDIEALGDSLQAVENTLLYGARLEKMQQHDRLGLDREMEFLSTAVKDGSAIEVGAIREILTRIATDDQLIERARRRARLLLTQNRP